MPMGFCVTYITRIVVAKRWIGQRWRSTCAEWHVGILNDDLPNALHSWCVFFHTVAEETHLGGILVNSCVEQKSAYQSGIRA